MFKPRQVQSLDRIPGRFLKRCWLGLAILVLTFASAASSRVWATQPPAAQRSDDNSNRNRKAERRAERQRQLAAQPLLDTIIPVDQLKKDYQLFRDILEQAHGGLYLHTSKEIFDGSFDTVARSLTKPMKVRDFNMLLAPLIDATHCGHTSITISNKQLDHFMKAGQLFPVPIVFLNQKPCVDHDKVELPLGAEILTVNGVAMDEIVKKVLVLAPADGLGSAMKYRTLPIDFDLAYALAYGEPEEFKISCLPFGAKEPVVKTLAAIPGKRTVALYESRYSARRKAKKFRYQSLNENTGLLTINTFEFGISKKSKQKYKDFLRATFASLAGESGKQNLIVDLRENEGGYPKNEMLLASYLARKPFREMK
ncbi:MAG: S41 family peptidase, partial [Pirellulaceae bacterium]